MPDKSRQHVIPKRCIRCVMDTTYPSVTFNEAGVCNYCTECAAKEEFRTRRREMDPSRLDRTIDHLKRAGKNKSFDCVLGVSGGVDSTYVALMLRDYGVRTLLVQFDNGWNSELAVGNIQRLVAAVGFHLATHVVEWDEFREVQLAFMRASVVDLEVPSDHGIIATLIGVAKRHGIRSIVSGVNSSTEGIAPPDFGYNRMDPWFFKSVVSRHSKARLRTIPVLSLTEQARLIAMKTPAFINILDLRNEPYVKATAKAEIGTRIGWRDYGGKHHESVITKFHQIRYMPAKVGIDKRLVHLSCLIYSGQIARADALEELGQPAASIQEASDLTEYVAKKLRITSAELEELIHRPPTDPMTYRNAAWFYRAVASAVRLRGALRRTN